MKNPALAPRVICFGVFEFSPQTGELRRHGLVGAASFQNLVAVAGVSGKDSISAWTSIRLAVMDTGGKLIMECLLETKAATVLEFIQGLHGTLSLTFEEGTSAAWLHERIARRGLLNVG